MIHHWIHHTEDHVKSYRQWAEKARQEGLESVAQALERVADGSLELNRILEEAEKQLD
jgi:rubrerythrin